MSLAHAALLWLLFCVWAVAWVAINWEGLK